MNPPDPEVILINLAAADCLKAVIITAFLMPITFAIMAIIDQLKGK